MEHLPIFLNVNGKRTLIAGNGVSAARKADLLLRAGSDLTIVAPQLGEELSRLADTWVFKHQATELTAADLRGCVVVFGCSGDDAVNDELCRLAADAGIMVNVSDKTEDCDFIMPAVVDRTPLLIAISSGGLFAVTGEDAQGTFRNYDSGSLRSTGRVRRTLPGPHKRTDSKPDPPTAFLGSDGIRAGCRAPFFQPARAGRIIDGEPARRGGSGR